MSTAAHTTAGDTEPLRGWATLVTRPAGAGAGVARRLQSYGATCIQAPTIVIAPPLGTTRLDAALAALAAGSYAWVGFTSANAVAALHSRAAGADPEVVFGPAAVAAVGARTADALLAWGVRPLLVASAPSSAAGLLAIWPAPPAVLSPAGRVLVPRSDIAGTELVDGLAGAGWLVDDVVAYRTLPAVVPAPVVGALAAGGFDAVLFTSVSSVAGLVAAVGVLPARTLVACIGPVTAQAAAAAGLRVGVVAAAATGDALVDALAVYGATHPRRP